MYDMHYDLLTILYYNLTKGNQFSNVSKMLEDCNKIYHSNNIVGGIINLYFMSPNEMLSEIGITSAELKDVKGMFRRSIEYLKGLMERNIIPYYTDFLYSIEGCDYLEDEYDLEDLYKLGLGSILPVWNEKNKFGSGNRSLSGLTNMGKRLIKKAIELGIMVDVSHANKNTFYDILDVVEEEKKNHREVIVVATHSNVRALCNMDRNLDDEQLKRLRDIGGYIGLFTNSKFLVEDYDNLDYSKRQQAFLKHLEYVIYQIGFPIDRIIVSTDDMNFHPDLSYHYREAFPIETIADDIWNFISNYFGEEIAKAILVTNPSRMIFQVKQRRKNILLKDNHCK